MSKPDRHLEDLAVIRSMMEQSTRFLSLSGLSGVVAGLAALAGAITAFYYLDIPFFDVRGYYVESYEYSNWGLNLNQFFLLDAAIVLIVALLGGFYFTSRKAKNEGKKIWTQASQRLAVNLFIPLATGGLFSLLLLQHGLFGVVAPTTLIFYGLALLNASKYTLDDIRYLGISEIVLGLIATYFIGYGLLFWAIGFGVLHIVYGLRMYFKYGA